MRVVNPIKLYGYKNWCNFCWLLVRWILFWCNVYQKLLYRIYPMLIEVCFNSYTLLRGQLNCKEFCNFFPGFNFGHLDHLCISVPLHVYHTGYRLLRRNCTRYRFHRCSHRRQWCHHRGSMHWCLPYPQSGFYICWPYFWKDVPVWDTTYCLP